MAAIATDSAETWFKIIFLSLQVSIVFRQQLILTAIVQNDSHYSRFCHLLHC